MWYLFRLPSPLTPLLVKEKGKEKHQNLSWKVLGKNIYTPNFPQNQKSKIEKMVTNQDTQVKNKIFRKQALQKVASPEQLDLLVKITSPKRWISLIALGSLVAAGGVWSWFGRIPIVVKGQGVLVYPSRVVTVQAANSGRILDLNVKVGDKVKKGQVLATLDQTELQKKLQLSRDKLSQLKIQDETAKIARVQRLSVEQAAIAQQRQTLESSLQTVESITPELLEREVQAIKRDRQNLLSRLQTLKQLQPTMKKRWDEREKLYQQGEVPKDLALKAKQEYIGTQEQINSVKSELNKLDVRETNAQGEYLKNLNQVNDLQAKLKELKSRQANQKEQDLILATNRAKEIKETERQISLIELQLLQTSKIVSQYDGTVLEIAAKPGQELSSGIGIVTISAQQSDDKLVNVSFLPVSEGKKIKPGMDLQITPSTVKREEYGGIKAKVIKTSEYPVTKQGIVSLIGNPDILPSVISEGPHIAVFTELEKDNSTNSGYKWSSSKGPELQITPGTTTTVRVKIEEKKPIEFVLPIFRDWTGI